MKSKINVQKAIKHISAVIKGVLFIGISIQTIMGIVWMYCNFPHVPQFEESLFYVQISRTLRCDEYTGILYPVFLWLVGRNHYVVYVLQLAAACAAALYFLRVLRIVKRWEMVWGCLAFITIPVVMQCHMAMLPCSFAASLLLTELSLLAEGIKNTEKRTLNKLTGMSFCWLLQALLLPEYFYLGAVPVALLFVCCYRKWRRNRRIGYYSFLLVAVFIGMVVGIQSLTQTRGLYDRLQKTPLMTLTQRIAWTSILEDYEDWPERMIDCVDRYTILEAAGDANGMDDLVFPAVEQAVKDQTITRQEAEGYYFTVMNLAWQWHKPAILKEIIWDILGYGAPPAVLQLFLAGRGYDTCSSRNYDFFLEYTPELSKIYMDYGSWWFIVAAVLTALLQGLQLLGGRTREKKESAAVILCFLITAGIIVIWYTMQGAGIMDYKKVAVIAQLWMAWTILLPGRGVKPMPEGKD